MTYRLYISKEEEPGPGFEIRHVNRLPAYVNFLDDSISRHIAPVNRMMKEYRGTVRLTPGPTERDYIDFDSEQDCVMFLLRWS